MARCPTTFAAATVLALTALAPAQAQTEPRKMVYVSRTGVETDDCDSWQAPCKQIWSALRNVADRGTINVLDTPDSGGTLEINKSVTIKGPLAFRADRYEQGPGIRIDPGPSGFVVLDGAIVSGDRGASEYNGNLGIVVTVGT